jgi:lipoprotein-anchoring transpeptidase ErfK/SrfK
MLRFNRRGVPQLRPFDSFRAALPIVATLTALTAILTSVFAPLASAQDDGWSPPSKVWVEESGHTVDKTFLHVWRANLVLIGDPITQEVRDRVKLDDVKTKERTLQYYDNLVLVSTGDDMRGDDWHVRAMPLGIEAFELDAKRLKDVKLPRTDKCEEFEESDCHYFKETKHAIKLGFKAYWDDHQGEQLLGAPLTEEFVAPDGWTTQYFQNGVLLWKKDKGVSPRAIGKEAAAREKVKTKAVEQPEDVPAYAESLFSEPQVVEVTTPIGPGPQQGAYKEVVVSVSQQYMWAYEDGTEVIESWVSTGTAETEAVTTPVGYWSVLTKYDVQTMEGTISGEHYRVADVPYVMYFDNLGNALHGTYWHSNFGYPMSHGCVNLPMDVAAYLYSWTDIGTAVTVVP